MYLLDNILLQVAKLSRALQTKHLNHTLISSLVDATLNSLDDAILPSANWVLQLQDAREELKAATGIEVTHLNIYPFQERMISMCYQPTVFLIQRKCPASLLMSYLYMEIVQFKLSLEFGRDLPAKSLEGTEFEKAAIVSSDLSTEWKRIVSSLLSSQKMIYPCN